MKKLLIGILMVMVMVGFSGCAGKSSYVQPNLDININKTVIIINENKRVVWDKLLKKISDEYFVINNLEYDSGFLNLSFNSNDKKWIDCGCYNIQLPESMNNNLYDESKEEYQKPKYECISVLSDNLVDKYCEGVWVVKKNHCSISGRTNILVQEIDENKTEISFSIKYIVDVSRVVWSAWDGSLRYIDFDIGFNSGSYGYSNGITCKSTGFYEWKLKNIVESIK